MSESFTATALARRPGDDGPDPYQIIKVDFRVDGAPRPLNREETIAAAKAAAAGFGWDVKQIQTVEHRT